MEQELREQNRRLKIVYRMTATASRAETLAEELFILQIMGDDRAVVETYIAGRPMKVAAEGRRG